MPASWGPPPMRGAHARSPSAPVAPRVSRAVCCGGADRRYLRLIAENYQGGPVGIETMSAALSESRDALEEVIEPYLLQQGLIQRTPRGRMLAQKAWSHLGMAPPKPQSDLFG